MVRSQNLYQGVVDITREYLGPAADRFITRQIRNHLQKDPERLAREDLVELIDWMRLAMSLLTDDIDLINEYTSQLQLLVKNFSKGSHSGASSKK